MIDIAKNTPHIDGVTITGGDPLLQYEEVVQLCRKIKAETAFDIVMYTGYVYEDIRVKFPLILSCVDFIVDGPFIQEMKDSSLYFMGSSNQRYIDVRLTEEQGKIVQRSDYCISEPRSVG